MSRLFATLTLGLACLSAVYAAPIQAAPPKKLTPLEKIKRLDIYNQVLPVVMTSEQIKALLPVIEQAQEKERRLIKQEADEMKAMDERFDKALDAAAKGEVPSRELQQDIHKLFRDFRMRRLALTIDSTEDLVLLLKKTLDEGQIKAVANAISVAEIAPDKKPEDVTEDEKLRGWVRIVLLDPMAYDLLVEMSRKS
ncbi:MAG: hypothetical protein AB7F50_04890 [Fimbriimonadaceae bacterium]